MRRAFTLIELMIVIAIIGILSLLALAGGSAAYQQSKVQRTQAIVAKIDSLIMEKWEGYRTRPVPIRINPSLQLTPRQVGLIRLNAIRELQRMEMPDRMSDVSSGPVILVSANGGSAPSLWKQYNRRAAATWDSPNENAECLYLILAAMRDGDKSALDFFSPSEIGDVDNDGMNEILDSFGQPITFLRWPAGYRNDWVPNPVTMQDGSTPDSFDPMKVDYRFSDADTTNDPIALKPLVWSAGPDKLHDINVGGGFTYASTSPPNDPYVNGGIIGIPSDANADGYLSYADNITNHDIEAR